MRSFRRWVRLNRWGLVFGAAVAFSAVADTYGLITSGFHPNRYWPYWYTMWFLGLWLACIKREPAVKFLRTKFALIPADDQVHID